MERIDINPQRLVWCLNDHGVTLNQLSAEIAISSASLEKALSNEVGLTFNQLKKLAGYFGRGVLFFLEQDEIDIGRVHTPAFRTLSNQKPELTPKLKTLIERVEKQREIYMSLREDLDDASFPAFNPPNLPLNDISESARIVRIWLRLNAENTFESYRTAVETQGILVFRSNGYGGKWQIAKENPIIGFSLYDAKCPLIVVKKQNWDTQQTFTLMHELAHILLHKQSSIDDEQDMLSHQGMEREANAFAGQLLVPNSHLTHINDREKPQEASQYSIWLDEYRKAWGVSCEVILRRLLDNGRLMAHEYAAYREWWGKQVFTVSPGGNRQYRHREPKHIFGDTFVRSVLDSLSVKNITLAKASNYLDGINVSDVHALEHHYAGN